VKVLTKVDRDCIQVIARCCMLGSWSGGNELTGLSMNLASVLELKRRGKVRGGELIVEPIRGHTGHTNRAQWNRKVAVLCQDSAPLLGFAWTAVRRTPATPILHCVLYKYCSSTI